MTKHAFTGWRSSRMHERKSNGYEHNLVHRAHTRKSWLRFDFAHAHQLDNGFWTCVATFSSPEPHFCTSVSSMMRKLNEQLCYQYGIFPVKSLIPVKPVKNLTRENRNLFAKATRIHAVTIPLKRKIQMWNAQWFLTDRSSMIAVTHDAIDSGFLNCKRSSDCQKLFILRGQKE